jgi:DnaJ-class molecular chaperone
MTPKDYYRILGVSRDAETEAIRKAFRHQALRYHPDHNPGNSKRAEEKFKEINEAYEVLGDEQTRLHYDRSIGWSGSPWKTMAAEDIFEDTFMHSRNLDWIKEIMKKFTELDPSFRAFSHRRSWGCKRQRGWRCRREQW